MWVLVLGLEQISLQINLTQPDIFQRWLFWLNIMGRSQVKTLVVYIEQPLNILMTAMILYASFLDSFFGRMTNYIEEVALMSIIISYLKSKPDIEFSSNWRPFLKYNLIHGFVPHPQFGLFYIFLHKSLHFNFWEVKFLVLKFVVLVTDLYCIK